LGKESILLNNLVNQLNLLNDDVKNVGVYYKKGTVDVLICNPPFFKVNDLKVINVKPELSYARHEISINLEEVFKIAHMYLKNKGSLYMVHRSDRLDEIINFGYKYQVNVKQIQFISTKNGESPKMVLVKCIKNSKQGVKVAPELCIEGVKSYKKIFREEK
jgi:tRNA1(Val) A37 N6-methylase TrmN6